MSGKQAAIPLPHEALDDLAEKVGLEDICDAAAEFLVTHGKTALPTGYSAVPTDTLDQLEEDSRLNTSSEAGDKRFASTLETRLGAVHEALKRFGLGDTPSTIVNGLVRRFGEWATKTGKVGDINEVIWNLNVQISECRGRPGDEEHLKALQQLQIKALERRLEMSDKDNQ